MLRRRISTRSMPIWVAAISTSRSSTKVASPSSAAIGVDRHGVSKDHLDLAVDSRGGIDTGKQWAVKVGRDVGPERRDVAAKIGDGLYPQPEKLAVGVERELRFGDVITAVSVRVLGRASCRELVDVY